MLVVMTTLISTTCLTMPVRLSACWASSGVARFPWVERRGEM